MDDGSIHEVKIDYSHANGVVNVSDDLYFDDLVVNWDQPPNKRVKAFSDQRRKLKPNRRHVASSNPLKILQQRENVKDQYDYINNQSVREGNRFKCPECQLISDECECENDEFEKKEIKIELLPENRNNIIGRQSDISAGKIKEREFALTVDAKRGLESKEDIYGASKSLRVTEKDVRTGIGTEKTNIYDGVKEVMLFHIKGARHIQTRLVQPQSSSLNSGDVFVMVTPKHIFQWNGKNSSIMEKARGAEITSVLHQWKELGCNADVIHVIDEGHDKPGVNTFWEILGDKCKIKGVDDVIQDKEFEKSILESNYFYEIRCKNMDDEDAECWLEQVIKYSGCIPSKKWLCSDKAYVLDFGTEVYSWIGCKVGGAPRRKAADIGLEVFNKGFQTNAKVHPYDINRKESYTSELLPRPEWSVYGRMAEKTENVAFRRKFFDWPDPVDLKVKTVEAKVHCQLTKDYTNDDTQVLYPVSANQLIQPTEEPLMILDGSFIGRGKGMEDMETLFHYGVTTNYLTIWKISGNSFEELPTERHGIFYSAEAYVLKWNFEIFRTGINCLKGGKSRQEDTGKNRTIFFFWQGRDCTSNEKGQAALHTIHLNTDEGPMVLVLQGKEPPAFFQLFDGKMIVHADKCSDENRFLGRRLYWVRNEAEVETCLVEVPLTSTSLRSRSSFIVADTSCEALYIWHGSKSLPVTQKRAVKCAKNLKQRTMQLYSKTLKIYEMTEGHEVDEFWDFFGDDENYLSFLEVKRDFKFTPRCFSFDIIYGYFRHAEIACSSYHPGYICPFPILQSDLYELSQPALVFIDAKYKMYLWEGWWPLQSADAVETAAEKHKFNISRKVAMQSLKAYAEEVGRSLSRAYIVCAGCEPLEFKNLFPYWSDDDDISKFQLEHGKTNGEKMNLMEVLQLLEKDVYTLSELTQPVLPEGVDPTRIEQYLNDDEFKRIFDVEKTAFKGLPRWKQIELKKSAGLF